MKRYAAVFAAALMLPGIAVSAQAPKYDYPTEARVEYVFECMNQHGGQNYDTLYKCSCSIDYIADRVPYDDYVTLQTYVRGQHAGGERPEVLREGRLAHDSRSRMADLKHKAADQCLIHAGKTKQGDSDNG